MSFYRETCMVYFYNNCFTPSLSLDVNNLGLLRGYSAFEYLRTYHKKPFCLKAHLYRFMYSMERMNIKCPYTLQQLEDITYKLISYENKDCGIKWYATGGLSTDGLHYQQAPEVFAFTLPMTPISPTYYHEGIHAETREEKRPLPEAKTTAYFGACEALSANPHLQEILYINAHKEFLEGATSNLFLVKDNTLYTAPTEVLHGITREVVLELAKNRFKVVFKKINYQDLDSFDEAFLTATNKEILPIRRIDNIEFVIGPVSQTLMRAFKELISNNSNIDYIPELYQKDVLLKS
jgi:branched-chain amino acid aminotransferase